MVFRCLRERTEHIMRTRALLAGIVMVLLLCGPAAAGYIDNGNGTVTDTATGLVWQKQDDAKKRTWAEAVAYCKGLSLAGHKDWRLPEVKELQSILDSKRRAPAIDPIFTGAKSYGYWSGTDHTTFFTQAWWIYFLDGGLGYNSKTDPTFAIYVRCVR